jgi:DNA/RNA-binding protein KIN17
MPKHDFLSPKAIANRIKGKGLQKLRWYCQMCQKQCRDENGFKCHCESESHQRQMKLFAENQGSYIDAFSEEFEESFMDILSRRFRSTRVWCNVVYQEVVADKGHIHMNSTKWETLTTFVKYLGKGGKCTVEEGITPSGQPGLFLRYIIRDSESMAKQVSSRNMCLRCGTMTRGLLLFCVWPGGFNYVRMRQERLKKKEESEANEEERGMKQLEKQIRKAQKTGGGAAGGPDSAATELKREEGEAMKTFSLVKKTSTDQKSGTKLVKTSAFGPSAFGAAAFGAADSDGVGGGGGGVKRKKSALEEIMAKEKDKKQKQETAKRTDWWLQEGIIVKVLDKKLSSGKYHKKKGVVRRLPSPSSPVHGPITHLIPKICAEPRHGSTQRSGSAGAQRARALCRRAEDDRQRACGGARAPSPSPAAPPSRRAIALGGGLLSAPARARCGDRRAGSGTPCGWTRRCWRPSSPRLAGASACCRGRTPGTRAQSSRSMRTGSRSPLLSTETRPASSNPRRRSSFPMRTSARSAETGCDTKMCWRALKLGCALKNVEHGFSRMVGPSSLCQ